MSSLRTLRLLGRVLILIVLVASGTYFIVYLYRWEWNRAKVSGVIFLAAEITLLGSIVLRRLRDIEQRLEQRDEPGPPVESGGTRFPWLDPNRTAVFIPVLLGAGAVLAALAWVVERAAAYVAGGNMSQPRRLDRLAFPSGDLAPAHVRSKQRRVGRIAGWLAGAGLLVVGITVLADYTQSRPEASNRPGVTVVTVRFGYRVGDEVPVLDTAVALFESCRLRLPHTSQLTSRPEEIREHTVVMQIAPALGDLGTRRLRGCLEDYTLDGVLAYVEDIRYAP